ncbi:hypothetical protein, partial [Nocardia farcinica]|uniref:hypothetical protein n=1 Tax=Nocardia farcinica TaxID=37329 RepID=UPI002457B7F8
IDAARAAAAEAENEALSARRELARAIEDKTLAEGAAEDAIADRDRGDDWWRSQVPPHHS